jgi:hypothetical protein
VLRTKKKLKKFMKIVVLSYTISHETIHSTVLYKYLLNLKIYMLIEDNMNYSLIFFIIF